MSKPIVTLTDVSFEPAGNKIVNNISFEVSSGELVSLIGLNGAGKTTILKLILGSIKPTNGQVAIHTKRIGYVPQRFEFDRSIPLTAKELLSIYSGASSEVILQKLKEVKADHLANKFIGGLSGGEMQRVLIANALLQEPELLLMDEATAGLDVEGEKDFYCLMDELHKKYSFTIVMVSHDIHLVFKHATRVICVNKRICCTGSPKEIRDNPEFTKLFGPHFSPFTHHEHDSDHH